MTRYPLDPEINLKVQDDTQDDAVQSALKLLQDNYSDKSEQDERNSRIQELFEEGFDVKSAYGPKKISSKKLYQAIWRTANRMKPLDFSVHGSARPEELEKIVTDGVSTVMTRGGYGGALRNKNGIFHKLLMYGDGFMQIGTNPRKGTNTPIQFRPVSNGNVYVDPYATAIRTETGSQEASKVCVIFSYPWSSAVDLYPELEKIGGPGKIPRSNTMEKDLERSYSQNTDMDSSDVTEIGYYYDIDNMNYTVFAGSSCTILEQHEKDEYPFIKDKQPYIPIVQFLCAPSTEGFYNHGIGAMLYDLALLSRRLLNLEAGHIEDNVYPDTLLYVPEGEASKFFNKLRAAREMRANGRKPYVAMEYDPNNPNSANVHAQSLLTNNLASEWQMMYQMIDKEIQRMGVFLDEADRGSSVTATQILAEEESANAFVKQIMEYNASETQFVAELTLDFIKQFVGKKDKTMLNLTTMVQLPGGGEIRPDEVTLGMVKDEIAKNNYFVKVNSRTGAIPSNIVQQAQISRVLQATAPGSPAYFKLMGQFASLNDRDIKGDEFMMQAPEAPQGGQAGGEVAQAANPSQTDRMLVGANITEPEAAL
jgi:hypothetical protein